MSSERLFLLHQIAMRTMTTVNHQTSISPEDQRDITELRENIDLYENGQIDEEHFKLYRLTRGVYGQRQLGVQMFRIKIPFGSFTADQLIQIADVSDK